MKYTWELEDIQAGRRIWIGVDASDGECMITYRRASGGFQEWGIVSLTDGLVYIDYRSKEELLKRIQGYRPLTVMEPYMKHAGDDLDWRGAHRAEARRTWTPSRPHPMKETTT